MFAANRYQWDRIRICSVLIVVSFVSVLTLSSQSAASMSTYVLAMVMLGSVRSWDDIFGVPLFWGIAATLVYLVMSSFWSAEFAWRDTWSVIARCILILFFVVAVAECQLRGQVQRWLGRALAISGSLAAATALVLFVADRPEDGRLDALGQLDNEVVAALIFGVVLVLLADALVREESRPWRLLTLPVGALLAIAVVLSDSRNAWASVLVGLGVFACAHLIRDRTRFLVTVSSMLLVFGAAFAALLINDSTRAFLLPRGLSYRPEIWESTITRVLEGNIWFGRGILTDDNLTLRGVEFLHPHSMYVSVFAQGGLVGLALWLGLIVVVLRTLLRHYEDFDAKLAIAILAIALPAYCLDGHELLDKVGWNWYLFWFPAAIALGLGWRARLNAHR